MLAIKQNLNRTFTIKVSRLEITPRSPEDEPHLEKKKGRTDVIFSIPGRMNLCVTLTLTVRVVGFQKKGAEVTRL